MTEITLEHNCVLAATPGCFVVHEPCKSPRIVGVQDYDPAEFDVALEEEEIIPDMMIDPNSGLLTCINKSSTCRRSFFISMSCSVYDRQRLKIKCGTYRASDGKVRSCTTLVIVVQPRRSMDVCYVSPNIERSEIPYFSNDSQLYSDICDVPNLSSCFEKVPHSFASQYTFPLAGEGPFLCSQGVCGAFTHFFPGTLHALDFECPVGTPVLSIFDGEVVNIEDSNVVSGIHVSNLHKWNSVMLRLNDGKFIEYVHIKAKSVSVKIGQKVRRGQKICQSGDVGFCPRPHLHIQLHESDDRTAPTVPLAFAADHIVCSSGSIADEKIATMLAKENPHSSCIPVAGYYYSSGQVFEASG
jgi:hypothetical protein